MPNFTKGSSPQVVPIPLSSCLIWTFMDGCCSLTWGPRRHPRQGHTPMCVQGSNNPVHLTQSHRRFWNCKREGSWSTSKYLLEWSFSHSVINSQTGNKLRKPIATGKGNVESNLSPIQKLAPRPAWAQAGWVGVRWVSSFLPLDFLLHETRTGIATFLDKHILLLLGKCFDGAKW